MPQQPMKYCSSCMTTKEITRLLVYRSDMTAVITMQCGHERSVDIQTAKIIMDLLYESWVGVNDKQQEND